MLRVFKRLLGSSRPSPGPAAENWKEQGNSLLAQGSTEEALACYQRAIEADAADGLAHLNAGFALQELSRHDQAATAFESALALDPDLADAHYLLGKSLLAQGALEGAATSFERALALNPGFAFAYRDLATVQERSGQRERAIDSHERAIACEPGFAAELGPELIRLLCEAARWSKALAWLDRLGPEPPALRLLRARVMQGMGRSDDALAILGQLLETDPQDPAALLARCNVLFELKRFPAALADCEGALAIDPDSVDALTSCAGICERLGDHDRALGLLHRALELRPDHLPASYNQGVCLLELGRCRDAIAAADRGLAFDPGDADLHWIKAVGHLLLGELRQGWLDHEWRWEARALGKRSPRPVCRGAMWTGAEPLAGKTIVLTDEQGLGDSIQFLRYAPLLAQRGANVLLRLPPALRPLAAELAPGCALAPEGEMPACDYFCPLLSLPLAFGTELESIPAHVPYLRSDAARREAWEQRLGPRRGPRVGLVWAGNAAHRNDANRSIALAALLAALPAHCERVSLQKEIRREDEAALAASGMWLAGEQLHTFADTAALIDCMDLVISVDTSVAHLAGALAKPLWLLLPFPPDWRWMMDREDSPWYPSARLFRQGEDCQWGPVLARLAAELRRLS
jgi:tetratricopeptide (TPR) repeat protein